MEKILSGWPQAVWYVPDFPMRKHDIVRIGIIKLGSPVPIKDLLKLN